MEGYYFIAFDVSDTRAQRCASYIARSLGKGAVLPQPYWALGAWRHYLEHVVSGAERIIVVLTAGFLITTEPFVQHQRRLVLQAGVTCGQKHIGLSRLLIVLVEECASLLHEESVFSRVPDWLDFRPIVKAEQVCQQLLLDALCPSSLSTRLPA